MIQTADPGAPSAPSGDEQVGSVTFQVAPGDPDAIDSAAVWHEQVSSQLGAHAASIAAAGQQALSGWEGDAASSYAQLHEEMIGAFKAGEVRAGDTAATMHSIAHELDRYQQEGRAALKQAEHWVQEATQQLLRVQQLKRQVAQAQQGVADARASADPGTDTHTGINPLANGIPSAITSAENTLTQLQNELTQAKRTLTDDNDQIKQWDQRGQQAWEDAESAVARFATVPLGPIQAPPMPGTPVFVTPHHESWLDGAWHTIEDGAKTVADGVWDGTKFVLDHPVIIDGIAVVALIAIPGGGLAIVAADGALDEVSAGYRLETHQIDDSQFWTDTAENVATTGLGAGASKFADGVSDLATKTETTGGVSATNIKRIVGIPATGLSTVWAAGQAKEDHGG